MSRRKNFTLNLHLSQELPIERRKKAHSAFRLVLAFAPVRLDERTLSRWPATVHLKGFTVEDRENAINDLIHSGNVRLRLERGVTVADVAPTHVCHLVEGGGEWD